MFFLLLSARHLLREPHDPGPGCSYSTRNRSRRTTPLSESFSLTKNKMIVLSSAPDNKPPAKRLLKPHHRPCENLSRYSACHFLTVFESTPNSDANRPIVKPDSRCSLRATTTRMIARRYTCRPSNNTDFGNNRLRQPSREQQRLSRTIYFSGRSFGPPRGLRGYLPR